MHRFEISFLNRVDIKHLRLVVAIERHGTILRAAEELSISQPSASKMLRDLEADLNVMLFNRGNRGMTPNLFGVAFLRHARLVLAQFRHAAEDIADLATGSGGRVRVGTLLAASAHILPAGIARLRRQRPKVVVEVVEGTNDRLFPLLLAGDLDLAVGRLSEFRHRQGVSQEQLYEEEVCIVARRDHRLASIRRLHLKDLLEEEWILPPPDTTLRRQVDMAFQENGLKSPAPAVESVSVLANRWLLLHTDMIGVWPRPVLQEDPLRPALAALPVRIATAMGAIGLSWRSDALLPPAADAFVKCLRDEAAEISEHNRAEARPVAELKTPDR